MSDPLDRATENLRAAAVPPGPSAELAAATVAAVAARAEPIHAQRRRRIMRIVGYGTAGTLAAGVMIAAGVLWVGAGPAQALEDALKKAEKAKSFRAVVRTTLVNAPAVMPPMPEQKIFGQGDKVRIEMGHVTSVGDGDAKRLVILDSKAKTAKTMTIPVQGNGIPAVAEAVKKLLAKEGAKELGERFLDGRKTRVYEVKGLDLGGGKADVTYWIDGKRNLPVRYEVTLAGGPAPMTQTLDYLGFDEDLDPKLFDMSIPEGYKVEEIDPATTNPKP